jgi:hypothetical protein
MEATDRDKELDVSTINRSNNKVTVSFSRIAEDPRIGDPSKVSMEPSR